MSRTIEDQLASLGDAVDEAMSVDLTLSSAADNTVISFDDERERRLPWLAVAAVLALVVVGVALVGRTVNNGNPVIADQPEFEEIVITDPLDVDLSALEAQSEQRRINEIGDQLTFDWDALPEEWDVRVVYSELGGASRDNRILDFDTYFQSVDIRVETGATINVELWGILDAETVTAGIEDFDRPLSGEDSMPLVGAEVDVRGQVGQFESGTLEWTEADALGVILTGPDSPEFDEDLLLVANSLEPVIAPIPWGRDVLAFNPAPFLIERLFTGEIRGEEWSVAFRAEPTSEQFSGLGLWSGSGWGEITFGPNPEQDPNRVATAINSTTFGQVIFADAPDLVAAVRLRTEAGSALIPTVPFVDDRRAVAAPVDDAVDPVALDFLDDTGRVLGTMPLDSLLPFSTTPLSGQVQLGQEETRTPEANDQQVEDIVITDPLNIDLSALVAQSDQRRINEIGDQLTFDWDALPDEWDVTIGEASLASEFGNGPNMYVQEVDIRVRRSLHFKVVIWGSTEQGSGAPVGLQEVSPLGATEIEVRGQAAQLQLGSITWEESNTLRVVVSGIPLDELEEDLLLIAQSLQPVRAPLQWGAAETSRGSRTSDTATTLLSGNLEDVEWSITSRNVENWSLLATVDGRIDESLGRVDPFDPNRVLVSFDALQGGEILYAEGPATVASVLLRTEAGNASIPVIEFGDERVAIAVPIDNRVDPIALDFVATDGRTLGTYSLENLLPYSNSSSGPAITLSE